MINPLYLFIFAGLFSPGPNVVLLITSGLRFGFRASLPHIFGVAFGVGIVAFLVGAGLAAVLEAEPRLTFILRLIAAGWILWLGWRLLQSAGLARGKEDARPFRFHEAVLFQWVNPKVWAVAVAAAAGFGGQGALLAEGLHLGLAFSGINLFVCLFWAYTGERLIPVLRDPARWRWFMRVMAGFLALSACLIFL